MTLERLANVGEMLGGLAVLVSLIYLILEVRRNTRSVRSAAVWNSELAFSEMNQAIALNPQFADVGMRGYRADASPEDFTEAEWGQLFFIARACMQKSQAQWFLWKQGDLPEELWQMRRRWAKTFISTSTYSPFWELEREQHVYLREFVESIESAPLSGKLVMDPTQSEPGAALP